MRVKGGRVRLVYGQSRYGVVPPRAPDIVAISALVYRLLHSTVGKRQPGRYPRNAVSFDEQGEDH